MINPFNPSFGRPPEIFLGRNDIIRDILSSIDEENSPWRTTLLVGIRGSGKTALLNSIHSRLASQNVVIVSVSPEDDFLNDILSQIYNQLPKSKLKIIPKVKELKINVGVSIGFENSPEEMPFTNIFRNHLTRMLDILRKENIHTLFLIDESQKHTSAMRTFIASYQKLIGQGYSISMVLAGLPSVVSAVLNDDVLTFLRRAKRVELENVDIALVNYDYRVAFQKSSFNIEPEIIGKAANFSCGYPYLFQLVGYYLWENAKDYYGDNLFEKAVIHAKTELFKNVHSLVFTDLSYKDREFIFAMLDDGNHTRFSDIVERLKKEKNYVSRYRERLISSGAVKSAGHGLLDFTYPYMREFLRTKRDENAYYY